jgi:toxin-antitoxin system PIN domain toxin
MKPAKPLSTASPLPLRYLLDVNLLLAAIWADHPQHDKAFAWLSGKSIILCPLSELGFLRISTNKKAINAPMEKARDLLNRFAADRKADRIADDLPALDSHPGKSEEVTDHYLADLAALHGARLATFDQNVTHSSVDVIR